MERGAYAFLAKQEARDHCVATILAAASDRPYVGAPLAAGTMAADERPDRPALSDRERTALLLWFQSMSKAAVATRMGIAETTVRQYMQRARIKYANAGRPAATRTQLLARAIQDGLIRADKVSRVRLPGQPHALDRPRRYGWYVSEPVVTERLFHETAAENSLRAAERLSARRGRGCGSSRRSSGSSPASGPTGPLHLGHYFGSLQRPGRGPVVRGADLACCWRTTRRSPTAPARVDLDRASTADIVLDYIAVGLDVQSDRGLGLPAQPGARALTSWMLPFLSAGARSAEIKQNPTVKERDNGDARQRPRSRADVQLPGAPGGRHPVLPRQPGARRPGPAGRTWRSPSEESPVRSTEDLQRRGGATSRSRCCCSARRRVAARHRRQEDGQERS